MNIQPISTSMPPQSNPEVRGVSRAANAAAVFVAPSQEGATAAQPVSPEQLEAAVDSVREYIRPHNNSLQFSVNDDIGRIVVTVVDSETEEVIRQIPAEEMIAIAKALDSIKGLLVRQQA